MDYIPQHVAIIMDGNGRWAKKRSMPRNFGHNEGMKRVIDIVKWSDELGIRIITLYAFSTENWQRPKNEISSLMSLLIIYIKSQLKILNNKNVKLNFLGDYSVLPENVKNEILNSIEITKNNTGLVLNIALNYGGRQEIIRAAELFSDNITSNNNFDINNFKQYLYTGDQPDPDLLIRVGGEKRLSNFLLFQLAYSEFFFSDTLWPDYTKKEFIDTINDFKNRNRRYGGLNE